MDNEIENADSLNGDTSNESNDSTDAQEEVARIKETNRQLFERAKKAEIELKELKSKATPDSKIEIKSQPNEPDYAKLAFLETKGINHPDDQKIIQDEANRLKLPLTDVLAMEHMKAKLEAQRESRDARAGIPRGKGRAGGATQGDVDYWLQKGETPDDPELAIKVVNARMKKEGNSNMFSDTLYDG